MPWGVFPYWHRVRRPALSLLSFVTKWGSHISRERFDLEQPNFTRTFKHVGSTTTPDKTSLYTSSRKLQRKNRRKGRLIRLQVEFLKNLLSEDYQISHNYRRPLIAQRCRIRRHSLLPVEYKMQLITSQKWWVKRVRPAKESKFRPLFNPDPTHVARTSVLTYSLRPHPIWRHQLLPIGIYRSSKNGRKCRNIWRSGGRRQRNWLHIEAVGEIDSGHECLT